jgi:hypothetical protein
MMADGETKTTNSRRSGGTAAAKKPAARARAKQPAARARAKPKAARAKKPAARSAAASRNGRSAAASRNGRSAAASRNGRAATPATGSAANGNGGIAGTIRHAAGRAKGPAVAVGAAAAGIAGGLALKSRRRRTTVLGVPVPGHLPSVDPRAMAKAVGGASLQFAKTSKSVSKDIERAADQAERIGKLLG